MKKASYLVAGLGKTGHSIAAYLQKRGLPFALFDTRQEAPGLPAFQEAFPDAPCYLANLPETVYESLIAVITSPGISLEEPFLKQARERHIPIIGDIECLVREISAPVIAITGTNGKSTVTTLVGEMAKADGKKVAVGGNLGTPVLELLDDGNEYELWVLELSSFQLDLTERLAPEAATILNVTPDHLDRHGDLTAYVEAKQRIYRQAKTLVINREDSLTFPEQHQESASIVSFGINAPTHQQWGIINKNGVTYLAFGEECLLNTETLRIKGFHNWQNALAACALAAAAGIRQQAILQVLQAFAGLPHRSQWVRSLHGVDWVNDSKGTNIGATLAAISGLGKAIKGKIVLIAGGLGKGADFTALRSDISNYVRAAILIGQDAMLIAEAIHDVTEIEQAKTLEEAVKIAQKIACPGDVVMLSPACASWDMFRDFNHRGDVFVHAVNGLS